MIRQFFRLYLTVMIPVLLLVALAHHYGSHANTRAAYIEGLRSGLQERFANTRDQIASLKLTDWEGRLPTLQETYAGDIQIDVASTALRRLRSNLQETARFERGDVAFVLKNRGFTRVYQQIPGTPLTVGSSVMIPVDHDVSATLYVIFGIAVVNIVVLWIWFHPSWLALERLGLLTREGATKPPARDGDGRFGQPLARTIDGMTTRLNDLLRMQRSQSNSIAHELTAPIAKLSFAIETLRDDPAAANTPELVQRMREDLQELDDLVAESLEYARLGSTRALVVEKTSLTAIMQSAVAAALKLPRAKAISCVPLAGDADRVFCDPRQIGRALSNLLRNANRHARATIVVSAETIGDRLWVHVDDDGEGVPTEHRARLFEPFARADDQLIAATRGYGLGLAIVRQVADLHGGEARIDDSPLGGARVSIGW